MPKEKADLLDAGGNVVGSVMVDLDPSPHVFEGGFYVEPQSDADKNLFQMRRIRTAQGRLLRVSSLWKVPDKKNDNHWRFTFTEA